MYLAIALTWVALVVWLLGRAFTQRNAFPALFPPAASAIQRGASVAVIVPARDEGHNIADCLASVLAQQYSLGCLRVIVVDDRSSDDTAEIVERIAAADSRVHLVRAPELPHGWTGKVHACWLGAQAAAPDAEWLCFLDADMRAQPALLASALDAVDSAQLDLLSLAPRQVLNSFAERLMLPCGLYLLSFCQDLRRIQSPDCPDAVATGQFMLIRRSAYNEAGGYASVRGCICEDVALARLLKRQGYRVLMQDGSALLSTRMYDGWRTLWPGISKNLSEMLGGPRRTLAIAAAAVTIAWAAVLLPVIQAASCAAGSHGACVMLAPAILGSAALFALHVAGAVHFGVPLWYGFLFPLGYSIGSVIALDSVRCRMLGGVRWKGRVYK